MRHYLALGPTLLRRSWVHVSKGATCCSHLPPWWLHLPCGTRSIHSRGKNHLSIVLVTVPFQVMSLTHRQMFLCRIYTEDIKFYFYSHCQTTQSPMTVSTTPTQRRRSRVTRQRLARGPARHRPGYYIGRCTRSLSLLQLLDLFLQGRDLSLCARPRMQASG